MEKLADHFLIVRDVEILARIFIAEEVVQLRKTAPRDGRGSHAAGLVRGEEKAVLRIRMPLPFPKLLDGVDLAVPQRRKGLHIRFGHHERKVVATQDRRSENLAADGHALARQGRDFVFDNIHEPIEQTLLHKRTDSLS